MKNSLLTPHMLGVSSSFYLILLLTRILAILRRDVLGRYRGSILGIVWAFITPLLMLAVYLLLLLVSLMRNGQKQAMRRSFSRYACLLD